jgi:molybdopterin/thiamine biosynthesis adenylyltransferase
MVDEEFRNQIGIIDVDVYDYLKVAIIGCGSIGSFLAFALNKIGFRNIILIDDDIIEPHNVATQFYLKGDVSQFKVETLSSYLEGNITTHITKVKANNKIKADIVFVCVDSLKARKAILQAILSSYESYKIPKLIIDGRMHRLVFRVFTTPLNDQQILNNYTATILEPEFEGACTEKGIIQNVFAIVSVMVEQLKKVINGQPFYAVLNCDLENYQFLGLNPSTIKIDGNVHTEVKP